MLIKKSLLVMTISSLAGLSQAGGSVDLSLTLNSVRAEHETRIVNTAAGFAIGGLYNESGDYLVSVAAHAVDPSAPQDLIAGIGGKLAVMQEHDQELGTALGLGGFVRYQPEFFYGAGVEVSGYYSPSVLSFAGANAYGEIIGRLNYKIMANARLFAGYNYIAYSDNDHTNHNLENSFNLGFRVNY
jgi:hypothetical protein